MNLEKILKDAYMSGVTESQVAEQIPNMRFDFEGMANAYAQIKVKELNIPPVMGCFGYPKKFEDFFFANYDYDLESGWSHKYNKERPQYKITVAKVYQYWLSVNNNP